MIHYGARYQRGESAKTVLNQSRLWPIGHNGDEFDTTIVV